jgi:tRNA modification GTPase
LNIDGVLFRLIDTAGIRDHSQDLIENIGMEKSLEKMRSANVVIYLFDVNEIDATTLNVVVENFNKENIPFLLVGNKSEGEIQSIKIKFAEFPDTIFISAKDHLQIDALKSALVKQAIHGDLQSESTIVTNARHFEALEKLAHALEEVQNGLTDLVTGDLLALDIRQCLHYLGTITGQITNDDQLDFIFSKFCIGK